MNKIDYQQLGMFIYHEKLSNGLNVYLIPMTNKKHYFITYYTNYGSVDLEFKDLDTNEVIKTPAGIAHFLEHKMFEQEEENPFEFYAKTGSECNASTSNTITKYILYGNSNLEDNLSYLIKYVNSPFFTEENVEKEKGIIIEELNMYNDMLEWQIEKHLLDATYKKHPMKLDIGGTVESVSKITKEDLYTCYNAFYQPSNMTLIIGGNFDVDKIINLIKKNSNIMNNNKNIKRKVWPEPVEVKTKYKKIRLDNVVVTRMIMNLKYSIKKLSNYERYENSMYINMILFILFGNSSSFRERMLQSGKITSLYHNVSFVDNIMTIEFGADTLYPEELEKEIIDCIQNETISEKDLERSKKVWISSEVIMSDNIEVMVNNICNDLVIYGEIKNNRIQDIRNMTCDKLNEYRKKIVTDNKTVLVIAPKKE